MFGKKIFENKTSKPILALLVFSVVSSLLIVIFENHQWINLVSMLFIFFIFINGNISYLIDSKKDIKNYFMIPSLNKTKLVPLIYLLFVSMLGFFGFNILSTVSGSMAVLTMLIFILFIFVNIQFYYFSFIYIKTEDLKKSLENSIRFTFKNWRKIFSLLAQYIIVVLKVSVVTLLTNIFVYSIQISKVLDLSEKKSTEKLIEIFSSPLSYFIQNVGVAFTTFYLFYLGSVFVTNQMKGGDISAKG